VVFLSPGYGWLRSSDQSSPLFEFHLPLESYPATPSRSAAADQHLSWAFVPFSTFRIEGPPDAGMPARYVPPSGFDYPLDGLLPSNPCRFFFTPAALLGFTLRRLVLREGIRSVSTRMLLPAVSPSGIPAAEAPGRPDGSQLPGFDPSRSPLQPEKCVSSTDCRNLPWVSAFQGLRAGISARISPGLLSRASMRDRRTGAAPCAPESQSVPAWPRPPCPPKRTHPHGATFLGFPHLFTPDIRPWGFPGYFVRLSPGRALLPTLRRSLEMPLVYRS
jgi:hypothetical protein